MPSANKKPIPRTIPYPQAWPKGEAEGPVGAGPPAMLLYADVRRVKPLGFVLSQIDRCRDIYTREDPRRFQLIFTLMSRLLSRLLSGAVYSMIQSDLIGCR